MIFVGMNTFQINIWKEEFWHFMSVPLKFALDSVSRAFKLISDSRVARSITSLGHCAKECCTFYSNAYLKFLIWYLNSMYVLGMPDYSDVAMLFLLRL